MFRFATSSNHRAWSRFNFQLGLAHPPVQRLDQQAHWLSDVVGGALVGHAVGRRLVRYHYDPEGDGAQTPPGYFFRLEPQISSDTYVLSAKGLEVAKTVSDPKPGQNYGHA